MGTSETIGAISHDALSKLTASLLSGNLVLPNHQLDPFSTKHYLVPHLCLQGTHFTDGLFMVLQ